MSALLRLGIAAGVLAAVVAFALVTGLISSREEGERERFVGQPCRENSDEPITAATLVSTTAASTETASPTTLPAPGRAVNGEPPLSEPEAALAKRYEPILNVAKADRFWPVPVPTILDLSIGRQFTSFSSPVRFSDHAQLSDLRPGGGTRQYLNYPAEVDYVEDQFCSVGRALGIPIPSLVQWNSSPDLLEPNRSAQFYLLDRPTPQGRDLQYWFFYPLNYLPASTNDVIFPHDPVAGIRANADFHEGDFEHVTVHLRQQGAALEASGVTMARHSDEDKTLAWDSPELQLSGDHPVVYAGFGGHASYNKCGPELRIVHLGPLRLPLIDWTFCAAGRNFVFGPETPLVDLRSVPWDCWPGHFGELPPHPVDQLFGEGPPGPFFQKDDKDITGVLCPDHGGAG